ncbi:MAG: hypothetical protein AB8Y22_02930 [Coxiella-like endosymbiont]
MKSLNHYKTSSPAIANYRYLTCDLFDSRIEKNKLSPLVNSFITFKVKEVTPKGKQRNQ